MPYIYHPRVSQQIIEWFRLHRWCWKCNDWVGLLHIHRGPVIER